MSKKISLLVMTLLALLNIVQASNATTPFVVFEVVGGKDVEQQVSDGHKTAIVFQTPANSTYEVTGFSLFAYTDETTINCTVDLYQGTVAAPGAFVATFGTQAWIALNGSQTFSYTPAPGIILNGNTIYWIVTQCADNTGATEWASWYADSTGIEQGSFTLLRNKHYTGGVWSNTNPDLVFALEAKPVIGVPTLSSPPHRTHTTDTTPTFTWGAVANANSYRLMIYLEDRSFVYKQRVFVTTYTLTGAEALSVDKYLWRVRVQDLTSTQWGNWSTRNTLFVD